MSLLALLVLLLRVSPGAEDPADPLAELWLRTHVIMAFGDGLALAGTSAGLAVYETKDCQLKRVAGLVLPSSIRDLLINDTTVYGALGPEGLAVFDLSRPQKPKLLDTIRVAGSVNRLAKVGDRLFAASGPMGLMVFDVQKPAKPRFLRAVSLPGTVKSLAVENGLLLAGADGVCRVAEDLQPVCAGNLHVDLVIPQKDLLFFSSGTRLCVLSRGATGDFAEPAVSSDCVTLPDRARDWELLPSGDLLLAAGPASCERLYLTKDGKPALETAFETPGTCVSLNLAGETVFIAADAGGPLCRKLQDKR